VKAQISIQALLFSVAALLLGGLTISVVAQLVIP